MMLPEVPPCVSELLKNVSLETVFKIAKVLALVLSAPLTFSACSSNLRKEAILFDSIWMKNVLPGCDILGYNSCNTRHHVWVCCIGL